MSEDDSNKVEEVGWIIGGQTAVGNGCKFVLDTKANEVKNGVGKCSRVIGGLYVKTSCIVLNIALIPNLTALCGYIKVMVLLPDFNTCIVELVMGHFGHDPFRPEKRWTFRSPEKRWTFRSNKYRRFAQKDGRFGQNVFVLQNRILFVDGFTE